MSVTAALVSAGLATAALAQSYPVKTSSLIAVSTTFYKKLTFDPKSSDLDFLVEFEPMSPADYAEAYFSLKEGLQSLFGRPVDLVCSSSVVNPYFRESIEASRQRVYAA